MNCIICLDNIEEKYIIKSQHCDCNAIYHLECWNKVYKNDLKCYVCNKVNIQDLYDTILYKDYNKIYITYLIIKDNNCCFKINNTKIKEIKINEHNKTKIYLIHYELYFYDKNILKKIIKYIDDNKTDKKKYKVLLMNLIKKSIKYILDIRDLTEEIEEEI